MKRFLFLNFAALVMFTLPAFAADNSNWSTGNFYQDILIYVIIAATLALLGVALLMLHVVNILANKILGPSLLKIEVPVKPMQNDLVEEKPKHTLWQKFIGLRPISEEKDLVMEHEFDGIVELNNPTPAWFMGLFYGTIVIAVAYMLNYHVLKWGKTQEEEYITEVQLADSLKKVFLAKSANAIDENNVLLITDAATISSGKGIYNKNCVACHGDKGQGTVGPNLTDDYWLHKGKISNIFKTIKYGVPEKGMISWEKTLSPKQISDAANFIKSLQGSNPPNPKAPQGQIEK